MDKRIVKTRSNIKKALKKLALETEIGKITISDLAHEAMVNRSTFYLHYKDVEEVAADIEADMASQIDSYIAQFDLNDIYGSTFLFFRKITNGLDEHPETKKYIFSSVNSTYIVGKIKEMFVTKTTDAVMRKFPNGDRDLLIYPTTYATAGIVDSYVKWQREESTSVNLDALIAIVSGMTEQIIKDSLNKLNDAKAE